MAEATGASHRRLPVEPRVPSLPSFPRSSSSLCIHLSLRDLSLCLGQEPPALLLLRELAGAPMADASSSSPPISTTAALIRSLRLGSGWTPLVFAVSRKFQDTAALLLVEQRMAPLPRHLARHR